MSHVDFVPKMIFFKKGTTLLHVPVVYRVEENAMPHVTLFLDTCHMSLSSMSLVTCLFRHLSHVTNLHVACRIKKTHVAVLILGSLSIILNRPGTPLDPEIPLSR